MHQMALENNYLVGETSKPAAVAEFELLDLVMGAIADLFGFLMIADSRSYQSLIGPISDLYL